MFKVYINPSCLNEKKYILNIVLSEWMGIEYEICNHKDKTYKIELPNGSAVVIPDIFLSMEEGGWLSIGSLAKSVYKKTFTFKSGSVFHDVPCFFYKDIGDQDNDLPIDIFGSAFYLLTCYEEVVVDKKDEHQRFLHQESLAYKFGFLNRAVVDEYVSILLNALLDHYPSLKIKKNSYEFQLSHDVDRPYFFWDMGIQSFVKVLGQALIKQKDYAKAALLLKNYLTVKMINPQKDIFYTFDWIMDNSEKNNLRSTFYFLAGGVTPFDGRYSLSEPRIQNLMKNIHQRGHHIGLHGSYDSYNNYEILKSEYDNLSQTMEKLGIDQELVSARQHYLRWDSLVTPGILNRVGLKNDSSLSFPKYAGFRCGTSQTFSMYDIHDRKALYIQETPLIVMEASVYDCMGMSPSEGKRYICGLIDECRKHNGTFALLWHNSEIRNQQEKQKYSDIIRLST